MTDIPTSDPIPPAGMAEKKAQKKPKKSSGGLKQWLLDSYNGLFKIVIQPQLPSMRSLIFMTIAFVLGLIWAYMMVPVKFYDAAPAQLSASHRDQYIKLIAGSYDARLYGDEQVVKLLSRVEDPAKTIERLIGEEPGTNLQQSLQRIYPLAQQAGNGTSAPKPGGIIRDILAFVASIIVLWVVVNIFALIWGLLIGGYFERAWQRFKPKSEEEKLRNEKAKQVRLDIERRRKLEVQLREESAKEAPSDLGPPLTQRISTYTKGRAYDDSFAIEDANDMFLGECGATIAKTLGETGELAAVEIWLFDKDDFVRTLTKLLVSEHAFNDPTMRAELDPRVENSATDIVIWNPGASVIVESKKIRVQAKVAELVPGATPGLPPNSHVEAMTLQIMAWERAAGGMSASAPVPPPVAAPRPLDSYEIGPPPPMPAGMQQPRSPEMPSGARPLDSYEIGPPPPIPSGMPSPGIAPLAPPPIRQAPQADEDDPFAGSGDFTPIPR